LKETTNEKEPDRMRVLIVDPNEDNRHILACFIEVMGHSVREAVSGPEAISMALTEMPEVIFMAARMPEMDGLTAAAHIRRVHGGEAPRLIMLVTYTPDSARMAAVNAADCVMLPFSRSRIRAAITGDTLTPDHANIATA
jgi:CheY-like chemotaxis protein